MVGKDEPDLQLTSVDRVSGPHRERRRGGLLLYLP